MRTSLDPTGQVRERHGAEGELIFEATRAVRTRSIGGFPTRSRFCVSAISALLLAALISCTPESGEGLEREPTRGRGAPVIGDGTDAPLDRVRVAVGPFLSTAPIHVGLDQGIFERFGLELELVALRRNMDALPSLISGRLDVGIGQPTIGVLRAIGNGARLRLVADAGHAGPGCANVALLTRPDLVHAGQLDSANRFLELTVETDRALPQAYWLDLAVRDLGLELDDLEPVNLPLPTVIEGLRAGRVDLASLSEPNLSRAVRDGDLVRWRNVADLAPGFQFSAVIFGPSLLDRRPDIGRRFLAAWLESAHGFERGPSEEHVALMAAATGEEFEVLRSACWPKRSATGRIQADGLLGYQTWALQRGLLDFEIPIDDLIDHALLPAATTGAPSR